MIFPQCRKNFGLANKCRTVNTVQVVEATWCNMPRKFKNLSIYNGILGTAFLCFRSYQATANLDDLHICKEIIHKCAVETASMRKLGYCSLSDFLSFLCFAIFISVFSCYVIYRCPSFHMGPPGIFALGAVVAKCMGNKHELDRYVKLLTAVLLLIMVD